MMKKIIIIIPVKKKETAQKTPTKIPSEMKTPTTMKKPD